MSRLKITRKVSISISDDRGKVRLRWSFNSRRYQLSTSFDYSTETLPVVKALIKTIKKDIQQNQFDESLALYKTFQPPTESTVPEINLKPSPADIKPEKEYDKQLINDFEFWTINYRHKDCDKNSHYNRIRNLLKRWGAFEIDNALLLLNKEDIAPKTYNNTLTLLHAFYKWAVKFKGYKVNPFEDVPTKKSSGGKKSNPKREPFTVEEINSILDAVLNNTYQPKSSRYPHSHYYPFIYFIFNSGVRPAEAVGLRVKHIDFNSNLINIEEVMARNLGKTNGGARIRKETKNGKIRSIPLNPDVKQLLLPLITNKQPDNLIFLSFTGLPIDDRMFQRRVLKPIIKELKIPERDLYAARHGFATRCIADDINPVVVAFMMGNNPETALRNYTHLQSLPKQIPSF